MADGECLFCRIAAGGAAAHRVVVTEQIVAFLDTAPIRPGHVQIVPKVHFGTFDELPADLAGEILLLGQRIARVQKEILRVQRVGFLFTGGDIAHAHAHVVPLHEKEGITSRRYIAEHELTFRSPPHPGEDTLAEIAERLRAAL